MVKADYHIHSDKSFDAIQGTTIESIYERAARRTLDSIILCDHYDVNWVADGSNPEIDFSDSRRQIDEAMTLHPSATKFYLGIELGQPHQLPEKARQILASCDFDFVLCSLHNARGEDDFYYIDYDNIKYERIVNIFEKYTEELCELAMWERIDALAHITYPLRYMLMNNIHIDLRKYYDLYRKLFKILIERGIALEVNTSGLRKKVNVTFPSFNLVQIYKNMGGELITVGSDAHSLPDIYSGIDYALARLEQIGIKYISIIRNGKIGQVKIS